MQWDIIVTIVVTATIQSLFGVGVLLFGTPMLLVLGYDFIAALTILLPISLMINLIQVARHRHHIDRVFYGRLLLYAIPLVILSLLLVTKAKFNIAVGVGLFLIFVALKTFVPAVDRAIHALVRYEKPYLTVMGVIHGLTNLGGSLLTAIVHSKDYEKDRARVTTAVSYGTFALFQLLTLFVSVDRFHVSPTDTLQLMGLGVGMFLVTEKMVYRSISTDQYRSIFAIFLFVSGVVLVAKTWL